MIAASALARRESRGVHRRSDFPAADPALDLRHHVVAADGTLRLERWPAASEPAAVPARSPAIDS
jgi:succinate dehydrogenase/fumarate reductase flavoprotein subunit